MKSYKEIEFYKFKDNLFDIAIPKIVTNIAKRQGYEHSKINSKLNDGTIIYPKEYFYPKRHSWEEPIITENTYTIHHYDGSWKSNTMKFRTTLKKILVKVVGYKRAQLIVDILKGNNKNAA